ncbi:uncharacterized protein BDR25DRAFT_270829 [Lindgomyces ingoldianus]|uniref:Uncharacterized protein n=1 Tax=Lindgomyces ingoldianus TaxID=673940 RepID=A0ACB6QFS5_9PLEO|nr:uncharacterized protein BDR25DRAFT_270829 [Lindgomyces ingoldianus]KAF2465005.1 hypothetical protein BDR25DRAFT_270829 [Lindgomyces ingoldianus]
MLSALRISRLLGITAGTDLETTVIRRALKVSSAKLGRVTSFISFFWLLFAVIGVQCFKSSLKRNCFPISTGTAGSNTTSTGPIQFCGGYIDNKTGLPEPWLKIDGTPGAVRHKGYLCPRGSLCQESMNPYNNSVSFDNIFQSLELVFVIFSANTFSTLMYNIMDTDGVVTAIFFAAVIIVLYFWLVILLIGVITDSIQDVRKKSQTAVSEKDHKLGKPTQRKDRDPSRFKRASLQKAFWKTKWLWITIITYNSTVQALRTESMAKNREKFINTSETAVTFLLLVEIVVRLALNPRNFHRSKQNLADLIIATVTSIMQLEILKRAGRVYTWLTFFQIVRIYRVLWAISPVRGLMMVSFTYFPSLLRLCNFLFLLVFLASILASVMFQNSLPVNNPTSQGKMPFSGTWISFLEMYQIFTGEDWTKLLYAVTERDSGQKAAWISAIFVIGWFILSSLIILNMFISRIDDRLEIPDSQKRLFQVREFLKRESVTSTGTNMHGERSLKGLQDSGKGGPTPSRATTLADTHRDAAIREFLGDDGLLAQLQASLARPMVEQSKSCPKVWWYQAAAKLSTRLPTLLTSRRSNYLLPTNTSSHSWRSLSLDYTGYYGKIRRGCEELLNQQLATHQHWGCSRATIFKTFIYITVAVQVLLTCVTTPLYQRTYWMTHPYTVKNWFVLTDLVFANIWTVEALIKMVAGGLIRGPNAYFRGWNLLDAMVLITVWTDIALSLYNEVGQAASFVAAFKALRVLRLLTINKKVMEEITLIFRRGSKRVFAAILVSLSLLTPFAIFGLNLFMGQSKSCNDPSHWDLRDCALEFEASGLSQWTILTPRVVTRPYYSFDNFGQSFYTLFLIVSQEGWTDVMYWARGISNDPTRPNTSTSNMNALFFVVFNFCGTIFVTALFASIMIQNYTEATGIAYLTRPQRGWIEQRRLLKRVRPSKRPPNPDSLSPWRLWCYERATGKQSKWQRFIAALLVLHLIILCIDFYPSIASWELTRDILSVLNISVLALNVIVRIIGLSWLQFIKRPWDLYGLISISGALSTSILQLCFRNNAAITQSKQILQDATCFLLIPYVPAFDELLNIVIASIPLLQTLLVTWFVLLLFFAISLTQVFGLTRFGANETGNVNFRNVPKALILLFRMTLGEGRTKIMEDFASIVPPYCTVGERRFDGDCGYAVLARVFFISWKVLSMYLFTNLFISLVYESFSYAYHGFNTKGGTITKNDIRQFKEAWASVDPKGTGYISPRLLPKFIARLSGGFSMRVYDDDFSISTLVKDCTFRLPLHPGEIDLGKLNERLQGLPAREIQGRRLAMKRFRTELLMGSDPRRGISFTAAMLGLVHYKILDDHQCLRFQEYLERAERLREVDEVLCKQSLAGFINMHLCTRSLRKRREGQEGQ